MGFVNSKISEEKILYFINDATKLLEPDLSLKGENFDKFQRIVYVLSANISFKEFIEKDSIKRMIIEKSIRNVYNKIITISDFYKVLEEEYEIFRKKPRQKYICIYPMNIDYSWFKSKKQITLDKYIIKFRSYEYVKKSFFKDNNEFNVKINPRVFFNFTFIIIQFYERNEMLALNSAIDYIELFRGILNYSDIVFTTTTNIGEEIPLSQYGKPRYGICIDLNKTSIITSPVWIHHKHLEPSKPIMKQEKIKNLEISIKKYNSLNNTNLKELIKNSLYLYNNALDEINDYFAYLRFWQILENIFSYSDNYKKLGKRLKNLFIDKDIMPYLIEIIIQKRHDLIHKPLLENVEQIDVQNVKMIVDNALTFLLWNANRYKTKKNYIFFLEKLSLNKMEIRNEINILNSIFRMKLS